MKFIFFLIMYNFCSGLGLLFDYGLSIDRDCEGKRLVIFYEMLNFYWFFFDILSMCVWDVMNKNKVIEGLELFGKIVW